MTDFAKCEMAFSWVQDYLLEMAKQSLENGNCQAHLKSVVKKKTRLTRIIVVFIFLKKTVIPLNILPGLRYAPCVRVLLIQLLLHSQNVSFVVAWFLPKLLGLAHQKLYGWDRAGT